MDNRSSSEIDNHVVELRKEHQVMLTDLSTVMTSRNKVSRELLELELKKHDLKTLIEKSRISIKQIENEIELEVSSFWRVKNEGR